MTTGHMPFGDGFNSLLDSWHDKTLSQFITDLPIIRSYAKLWPMYLVFATFLVAIAYYELKQKIIPEPITLTGIAIGAGFVAGFHYIYLLDSLLGIVVAFAGLSALNRQCLRSTGRPGIGAGDIKMQAMIGAFLGLENSFVALGIASILVTIYFFATGRRSVSDKIEFGPFLAFAALLCVLLPVSWRG